MATNIQSTRLDFNNIKNRLKTYLAAQPEFTDYNFEAAGLSNLLDVLAYNTHFNGLIANFALNEAFLNTAQLRSSVISLAESLGYTPRSKTSATAFVTLSLNLSGVGSRPATITLAKDTQFVTNVGNTQYTFQTREAYTATDDGTGLYVFVDENGSTSIPIVEGIRKTKTFFVGETTDTQIYVIPDINMDTSTAVVDVFESPTSGSFVNYSPLYTAIGVTAESTYYALHEAPNGYYELIFSDGESTGQSPSAGNKIVVDYLTSSGGDANLAFSFTPVSPVNVGGTNYSLNVSVQASASGGKDKETIESIRINAPIAFASQQRLVTAEDYRSVILSNYSNIVDVIAWGGEDNIPVQYGKTFVGLRFADNVTTAAQTATKQSIINNITTKLSMLSIDTEFVDPITTRLELDVFFNFDPDLTSITASTAQQNVLTAIQSYFDNNLKKFGSVYRKSNLTSIIQDLSPAILNARMNVRMQQRFTPALTVTPQAVTVNFPAPLEAPNGARRVVTSDSFILDGDIVFIGNQLLPHSSKLQIIRLDGTIVVDNIGQYTPATGQVLITGLLADELLGANTQISLKGIPANPETIRPLRNYILDWDRAASFAVAQIDRQTTQVTLS